MHTLVIVNEFSIEGCYSSDDIKIFNCDLTKDELKLWILEKKKEFDNAHIERERLVKLWHEESHKLTSTPEYKESHNERWVLKKKLNRHYNSVPKKNRDDLWSKNLAEMEARLCVLDNELEKAVPSFDYPNHIPKYKLGDLTIEFNESWDNIAWTIFTLEEFIQKYSTQSITVAFAKA